MARCVGLKCLASQDLATAVSVRRSLPNEILCVVIWISGINTGEWFGGLIKKVKCCII